MKLYRYTSTHSTMPIWVCFNVSIIVIEVHVELILDCKVKEAISSIQTLHNESFWLIFTFKLSKLGKCYFTSQKINQ